ncbi:MAG: NAD-binding protein [Methanosarcinales archaeon]|nr:TrkA family potassium uptake protein [ANME-2 cluster archaeon]MDW7777077.1 NAD-binding protein [Methanosarcinales archaeon]
MNGSLDLNEKHTIVLGYGDVGHRVVQRLMNAGVLFVVVDSNEGVFKDVDFTYYTGDATSESTLKKVGVEHASTVILTIGSDSNIIFAILVARKLNPDSVILARANDNQSIDKMYKAGADYVASLSIIAGQMLGQIAVLPHDHPLREETILMYEGIEIEKYTIGPSSPLAGKTLADLDLRNSIGCTVIGIHAEDKTRSEIDPHTVIKEGMTLAVLGNVEQITRFHETFVK